MDASADILLTYCFIEYLPDRKYVGNLTRLNLALNHEEHEAHEEKQSKTSRSSWLINN
jgi:hypothetical protein